MLHIRPAKDHASSTLLKEKEAFLNVGLQLLSELDTLNKVKHHEDLLCLDFTGLRQGVTSAKNITPAEQRPW